MQDIGLLSYGALKFVYPLIRTIPLMASNDVSTAITTGLYLSSKMKETNLYLCVIPPYCQGYAGKVTS